MGRRFGVLVKKVNRLCKEKTHIDKDNSAVIARGKGEWGMWKRARGVSGGGKRLYFGW